MDLEVSVDFENNGIEVSVDFPNIIINSGAGGNVDIINDETSAVIASIAAPGQYRVLVFSGIDGGNANTVYNNSIVSP